MAKKQSLEQIETSLARWTTRLRRAVTMVDKLHRQRGRLVRAQAKPPVPKPVEAPKPKPEPLAVTIMRELATDDPTPGVKVALTAREVADLEIPSFLRRQSDPAADAIRAEQAETKRLKAKGRIATMKAKQSGETRRMPLTGKAALGRD